MLTLTKYRNFLKFSKIIRRVCFHNYDFIQKLRGYASEATINLDENAFKLFLLESSPSTSVTITKEQAKAYYYDMAMIRRLETASDNLYKQKIIRGFCHLYSGQEAVAVGIKSVMRKQDNVIGGYRVHSWYYLMGMSIYQILAEQAGRKDGIQRGKGGSMHMYCPNFFGGNGIVGAQVALGTGIALACKQKGDGGVCIAAYGDGAANQGQVHECYNMACLWKLPVIFLCENNLYSMGTEISRGTCTPDFYKRGAFIPGIWVDGMNLLAVRSVTEFAIDYVLNVGPLVIEAYTYRFFGHSVSDSGLSYRTRDEVKATREKQDPISNFRKLCITNGLLTEEETKSIDKEVRKHVDAAVEKTKAAPEPDEKELFADVYVQNLEPKLRGIQGYVYDHMQINKRSSPK